MKTKKTVHKKLTDHQLKKIKDIEFIKTDSPEDMENNKALKSRLWSQLVISFNISV